MVQEKHKQSDAQKEEKNEGHLLVNIGKIVFLIAVLVVFWFFFERLIGSK